MKEEQQLVTSRKGTLFFGRSSRLAVRLFALCGTQPPKGVFVSLGKVFNVRIVENKSKLSRPGLFRTSTLKEM